MPITRTWTINPTTGRLEVSCTGSYGGGGGGDPTDPDLVAIADLATTAYGRGLLTLADSAALLAAAGAQASDSDLTAIAALATTSYGRSLLTLANVAALRTEARKPANTQASVATLTPDSDSYSMEALTAQAAALTVAAPTGTPEQGQRLVIRIKDNGTARAITWNAAYSPIGVVLPTTTVVNKKHYIGCMYNSTTSTWDVIAVVAEA